MGSWYATRFRNFHRSPSVLWILARSVSGGNALCRFGTQRVFFPQSLLPTRDRPDVETRTPTPSEVFVLPSAERNPRSARRGDDEHQ